MQQYLSKSDYLKFRVHPAYLWYHKHSPNQLPTTDENQQYAYKQGDEFEALAMEIIDDPVVISGSFTEVDQLKVKTDQAIKNGVKTLAQGVFTTNHGLLCRPDLLERIDDDQWRLSEIKSSTSFKRRHRYDLAFQRHVLSELGINVTKVRLLHVNRDYVRSGDVDPSRLVASRDVTEEVETLVNEVVREIKQAQRTVTATEVDEHPALAGNLSRWLEIYRHLKPELPADSILNLIQLSPQLVRDCHRRGITSMRELNIDNLTAKQTAQVKAWQTDKIFIDKQNITDFLSQLEFPLYFLDYETSAHVVPLFDGTKPYQQLPFQYSLHRLASPDAELEHFEYLHRDSSLPVEPLATKLLSEIGESGTVLAWFHKFEMYCNRIMAELSSDNRQQLLELNQRMVDLRLPFARLDYVDKEFQGSSSLKNVLPVLCPELSYKELGIQEGGAAQRLWQQAVFEDVGLDQGQVFSDLLAYCALDTYAMVAIYRELCETANYKAAPAQQSLL